jgi:hypothetical protein
MKHAVRVIVVLGLLTAVGCGSGSVATPVRTEGGPPVTEPPVALSEALCAAMTDDLVNAALGGAPGEPARGDVMGGEGEYCHMATSSTPPSAVEVQFDEMTEAEFNRLSQTLGVTEPLAGVGQAAFMSASAYTGGEGASVLAWDNGQTAIVLIERSGADSDSLVQVAGQIAAKVLSEL